MPSTALMVEGEDWRRRPLIERKARLKRLLGRRKRVLRYVEHLDDGGAEMFAHACRLGLEGMFKAPGSGVSLRPERGMAEDQEPGL
jgi:ATP-dependent DNA ligase